MPSLKVYVLNLNLFRPTDDTNEDEHEHRSNVIITRVYLVLLILSIIGFALGLWLIPLTKIFTLHHPSEDQFKVLRADANCPCSRISVVYEDFIKLEASFHQVCSSDFVSDRWIQTIFSGSNTTNFFPGDFRTTGSAQFQALASLCRLSKENINDSLASFYATSLISSQVLSRNLFESKIQASIKQFQSTVHLAFQSQLQLVNKMIFGNQLMSGLQTSILPLYTYGQTTKIQAVLSYGLSYWQANGSQCSCYSGYDCAGPSGTYDAFGNSAYFTVTEERLPALMIIPGLLSGCMPMNSLLLSTLECFYNQTCLNETLSFLSVSNNFIAMPVVEQSVFQPNSTLQSIVDRTMVENWTQNISYDKYFAQCASISCTYSNVERHDVVFVLTKVIGLLGGLTLVLGFVIPAIVRFIRQRRENNNEPIPHPRIRLSIRLNQLKLSLKRLLIELNLFQNQSLDDRHVRYQRIGTRLYIIILIVVIVTITLNSSLTEELHRETVFNPTETQYTHLEQIYPKSLVCSCSVISVSHQSFIFIEPLYHPICSSDYISSTWINYLNQAQNDFSTSLIPYHINLGAQFTILSIFCESVRQTIDDALRTFLQTQFVSSEVIAPDIFDPQIRLLVKNWQLSTINRYQYVIQLLRATNQGNLLMSDQFNFKIQVDSRSGRVTPIPLKYLDCSCALSESCSVPLSLVECLGAGSSNCVVRFTISNFFTGCFPVEALLQSTLECFYNRTCVDAIQMFMYNTGIATDVNVSTLDITGQWSNETAETVESIVNRLMVNSWEPNISFASYYKTCAPISCLFEYTTRPHILLVVSTVIGVFGGLSTGFKILMLIIVRSAEKIMEGYFRLSLMQFIKNILVCYNEQQITRRLQVILMIITLSILYLVTFLTPQLATIQIAKPSLFAYQDISEKFSDSLQCSCSKTSFQYQLFLTIEPHFHQVCSSEFMSDNWLAYVDSQVINRFAGYDRTDFQATATSQFQLLISLCQLSQKTINNTLLQLAASNYIDAQLTSSTLLNKRIQDTVDEFKLRTPKTFLNTLNLIRETSAANMLMSIYATNWKFNDLNAAITRYRDGFLETVSLDYQGCNCGVSSQCTQPPRGMMAGCYPLEALLQSTFQCFYDQQCIDSNNFFTALNSSSVSSKFAANSTIESIFQALMVEEYFINMSYENYFAQCAPSSCSYSNIERPKAIEIVTSLVELYGGLLIISQWICTLISKLCRHRIRQIDPQTH